MSELVSCNNKEVYFDQYCSSCKYFEQPESDEPCNTCLAYPMNECSHRPVYWKAKAGLTRVILQHLVKGEH